jgi:hypothetical protein
MMKLKTLVIFTLIFLITFSNATVIYACKCASINKNYIEQVIKDADVIIRVNGSDTRLLSNVTKNHNEEYFERIETYTVTVKDLIYSSDNFFGSIIELRTIQDIKVKGMCEQTCSNHFDKYLIRDFLNPRQDHILVLEREDTSYVVKADLPIGLESLAGDYTLFEQGTRYEKIREKILNIKKDNAEQEPMSLAYIYRAVLLIVIDKININL